MPQYASSTELASFRRNSMGSAESVDVAVAAVMHERDVLLRCLGDAADNCAKLRRERDRLKSQLAESENTIATFRSKGKLVVADRDRWEAAARQLESEIAELRSADPSSNRDKFKLAKAVISRTLHPDNAARGGDAMRRARTEIFKEIWPEIVKIDRSEA
jgi:PPC89-like protein with centrosome localization domain